MLSGLFAKIRLPILPAVLTATLAVLLACGGEAEPVATSTAVPVPATAELALPTFEQLGGGSPDKFIAVFDEGRANSMFRPTGDFAAAAKPLGEGEKLKVGIIFVGSQRDLGWNQAAAAGADYVEQTLPGVEIIRAENIPETVDVQAGGRADDPRRRNHRHTHQLRVFRPYQGHSGKTS